MPRGISKEVLINSNLMFLESMKQKNGKYKSGRHGSIKEL